MIQRAYACALISLAAGLGLFLLAITAFAQQSASPAPSIPHVGVLVPQSIAARWEAELGDALRNLGYVQGKNINLDWRRFEGSVEQAKPLAEELLRGKADLIVAATTPAARAVMNLTATVPVVFATGDPVAMGLAESLSRPGRNGTGISMLATELTAKRLELLKQLLPQARRILYLRNPSNPLGERMFGEARNAAQTLSVRLDAIDARNGAELDGALKVIRRSRADAFLVSEDLVFASDSAMDKITRLAREAKLPAVYPWYFYHVHGALMSYGTDRKHLYRLTAAYVDKILKGAKPADLPVEQISKYDLIIDLRVARAMRLTVPESLLLRADEVIR